VSGTSGGPWRAGEGAWPAPEANRAPDPAVGSTPVAGSLEEAPARTYAQEGRAVPELDEDIPADLAAAQPAPSAAPVDAKAEHTPERAKARASSRAAKEAASPAAEREDAGPADAEVRQAAQPRGYVPNWWHHLE
jgi:hypothetical protein